MWTPGWKADAPTEGSTPFRFSLHVGHVVHTLIVGPTGAGKSVLLALMGLLFRRHSGAQIFAFDFGGSIRAAALGDWHDLGGALSENAEERIARIDEHVEEAWAAEWIEAILAREGVTITPEAKEHIWSAVTSLASALASDARPNRCLLQIRPGRHCCRRSRHCRPRELRVRLALAGG